MIAREVIRSLAHLSVEDCDRVATLQKYHESLYLFGFGIPRYQFVQYNPPETNA